MSPQCLIVDQSPMVRRVAARIIRELGYEVIEAKSGLEALDLCRNALPAVVMLDWKTPDVAGAEFIGALRDVADQLGEPMPTILFCTGERSVEQIVTALRAGADEYIMKPFDSDIIESKFAMAGLLEHR
ncbi:PleD family two-component system response regulator [Algimonas porphyrae]|uniref:Response regulator n=1 Tax=Algimonas porphyrae TaxID=1128113 RepID=A0ABQ5V3C8_9PROT|nr:response regulator [Algimonas porphyrae]GLQ22006.1 response regulator [Algimonas porphyrae]